MSYIPMFGIFITFADEYVVCVCRIVWMDFSKFLMVEFPGCHIVEDEFVYAKFHCIDALEALSRCEYFANSNMRSFSFLFV